MIYIIMKITNLIKHIIDKFRCEHEYEFVRNIYGDQINQHDGMRSEWRCVKCGHVQYREYLHTPETLCEELDKLYNNYYKDKYNSWKELRSETLNGIIKTMRETASHGQCWVHVILYCEEKYNDKNYYEKWFYENGLKYEYNLHNQEERCNEVNCYEYRIRWKNR